MADAAAELERKIQRLNIRYDGMSDKRVKEKEALEREIYELRDQLTDLREREKQAVQDHEARQKQDVREVDEDLDFTLDAAVNVSDPRRQAEWERGAPEREAARRREVAEKSRQQAEQERHAIEHPAGEDLEHGNASAVAAGPAAAVGKDAVTKKMIDESKKQGCVTPPKVLAGIGIGIGAAVVIAVILVVLNGGADDKTKAATTGGAAATNGAAAPNGDGGSGDLAKFAGHYVLTSGFDDLNGPLIFATSPGAYETESLDPANGSIDVDADGTITGGTLQLGKHSAKGGMVCDFSFNATSVSGSVALYGDVGAIGQTMWTGPLRTSTCADSGYETGVQLSIGIVGTDLYVCGTSMTATLNSCQPPLPDPYAAFRKG
jgi:hypothetical protein